MLNTLLSVYLIVQLIPFILMGVLGLVLLIALMSDIGRAILSQLKNKWEKNNEHLNK